MFSIFLLLVLLFQIICEIEILFQFYSPLIFYFVFIINIWISFEDTDSYKIGRMKGVKGDISTEFVKLYSYREFGFEGGGDVVISCYLLVKFIVLLQRLNLLGQLVLHVSHQMLQKREWWLEYH